MAGWGSNLVLFKLGLSVCSLAENPVPVTPTVLMSYLVLVKITLLTDKKVFIVFLYNFYN